MIKGICIGDISIDCAEPARTRDFYATLTGWEKREAYGCPALIGDGLLILYSRSNYFWCVGFRDNNSRT